MNGTTKHRGCDLAWSIQGQGPPIVLIQGMGVGAGGWRPQVDALAGHYTCLSFDNRGLGASQPMGDSLSIELMADDTIALMDAQGWDSAHIVGHSIGGLIALAVATRAKARVRSLSLLCTFASGRVPTRPAWKLLTIGMRTRLGPRRARRRAFLELVVPARELATMDRDVFAEHLGDLFGHDLADSPPVLMKQFSATRRFDATASLAQLRGIPTLVMSAAEDVIAPPWAGKTLANGIPGARYVEVPDAAHGLPIQQASLVNAKLLEHLNAAEARTP